MKDENTPIAELRRAVRDLCREKHWGRDGDQDPRQVAMAMTVEMSELLENFQWMEEDEVERLWARKDPERIARIAEEFADVMMYGLQLTGTLGIDVASELEKKIEKVRRRGENYSAEKQRMRDEFEKRATGETSDH